MKIIDAFTFLNEVDLVKARFEFLKNIVTDFIVIESNQTWRHQPNRPFFADILFTLPQDIRSKIHHVVAEWPDHWLEDQQGVQEKWVEDGTRELAIIEARKFADDTDWFIMNDLDEFWEPNLWDSAKSAYENHGPVCWVQNNRVCFVDWETLDIKQWPGSKMAQIKDITDMKEFYCSKNKSWGKFYMFPGGWHFSKMGDEATKAKLMGSIREWRTWETKIGLTAEQAARQVFEGHGWNAVSKKKKTWAVPDKGQGLTRNIAEILKKYPALWSNGITPGSKKKKKKKDSDEKDSVDNRRV